MDKIEFLIIKNDYLVIDGINFSNTIFVKPIINDKNIIEREFDGESLAPISEWERCSGNSGKYLLFTSLTGIADDGGWDLCGVLHTENKISVHIKFEDLDFHYEFEKNTFNSAIRRARFEIDSFIDMNPSFHVEPPSIVFPEK